MQASLMRVSFLRVSRRNRVRRVRGFGLPRRPAQQQYCGKCESAQHPSAHRHLLQINFLLA